MLHSPHLVVLLVHLSTMSFHMLHYPIHCFILDVFTVLMDSCRAFIVTILIVNLVLSHLFTLMLYDHSSLIMQPFVKLFMPLLVISQCIAFLRPS